MALILTGAPTVLRVAVPSLRDAIDIVTRIASVCSECRRRVLPTRITAATAARASTPIAPPTDTRDCQWAQLCVARLRLCFVVRPSTSTICTAVICSCGHVVHALADTSSANASAAAPRCPLAFANLVNTMVGVTARLVFVAVKDHDLDDHVTEGE